MEPTLIDIQKRREQAIALAKMYVRAMPADPADEKARRRLQECGVTLLAPLAQTMADLFNEQLLPPYFELYEGKTLPDSSQTLDVTTDSNGRPTIRMAANAPQSQEAYTAIVSSYLAKHAKNTAPASLKFYKSLRDSTNSTMRLEWEFWRDRLFTDEQMERFPHNGWLRTLRILNGLTTEEMRELLGVTQDVYSRNENANAKVFSLSYCQKILDQNIFQLPTEEYDPQIVKREFAHKLLKKFGNAPDGLEPEYIHEKNVPQLAAAIKATAVAGFNDGKTTQPLDATALVNHLSRGKPISRTPGSGRSQISIPEWQAFRKENLLPESADFIFALPVEPDRKLLILNNTVHSALARKEFFTMAEQAQTLPLLLKRYSTCLQKTDEEIGKTLEIGKTAINNYHTRPILLPQKLDRIIKANAYDFPTGSDGKVHPEAANALRTLQRGEMYHNPFISAGGAAKELKITPMQPLDAAASWQKKVTLAATPEAEAFHSYWMQLEQQFKDTGTLEIAGKPVRPWINGWDRLQLHKDDVALIANDPLWRKTLSDQLSQNSRG
jgi:transcriptional regulator with XRE-family HTH domain